jgi:hypothetical protein
MPITQPDSNPTDPNATPRASATEPAPSDGRDEGEEAPKKKAPKWTIEEDKQLCAAWLNTSRDSIVGAGQKAGTFWERVHQLYADFVVDFNKDHKNSKTQKPLPVRPTNAIECRWGHILRVCNKFGGSYSQVERRMRSGMSRDDVVRLLSFIPFQSFVFSQLIFSRFLRPFSLLRPRSSTNPRTNQRSISITVGQS